MEDILKKKFPAFQVFSLSIKALKDHLETTLQNQGIDVKSDEIKWVLTVPAIWSDSAKQFMREAAIAVRSQPSLTLQIKIECIYEIVYVRPIVNGNFIENECNLISKNDFFFNLKKKVFFLRLDCRTRCCGSLWNRKPPPCSANICLWRNLWGPQRDSMSLNPALNTW